MSQEFNVWVYHATEKPKIVKKSEADILYQEGWADTPAAFIGKEQLKEDFGVDPDNPVDVQAIGQTFQGVVDATNGAINVDKMTKDQLNDYAAKHLPWLEIKPRTPVGAARKMVKKAIEDGRPEDG